MDEFIEDSTSPKHFGNFNSLDIDHNSTRHSARHHSNSCSAGMYDRSRKGQNDTDHWKEKARTCEKGIGKIYQVCIMYVCMYVYMYVCMYVSSLIRKW